MFSLACQAVFQTVFVFRVVEVNEASRALKELFSWQASAGRPAMALHASDVLTAGRRVYIPTECTEHPEHGERRAGRRASSDVWRRPETSRSLRSPRPEHVCWNSPPIKTGISQVRCGNQPSVGKHGVGACVLPSPALGPHAASSLPPVTLTLTVPPLLSHPHFCPCYPPFFLFTAT